MTDYFLYLRKQYQSLTKFTREKSSLLVDLLIKIRERQIHELKQKTEFRIKQRMFKQPKAIR